MTGLVKQKKLTIIKKNYRKLKAKSKYQKIILDNYLRLYYLLFALHTITEF